MITRRELLATIFALPVLPGVPATEQELTRPLGYESATVIDGPYGILGFMRRRSWIEDGRTMHVLEALFGVRRSGDTEVVLDQWWTCTNLNHPPREEDMQQFLGHWGWSNEQKPLPPHGGDDATA